MRNKTLAVAALLALALGLSGCANMIAQLKAKSGGTPAELQTALDKGDWDTVAVYCGGKDKAGKKVHWKVKKKACNAKKANDKAAGEKAFADAKCADLPGVWEKYKRSHKKKFNDVAIRLAKCGNWKYVFVDMMHWGPMTHGAMGIKMLMAVQKSGQDVEKNFFKFMAKVGTNPFDAKTAPYALAHYITWREKKGGKIDCKAYIKHFKVFDEGSPMAWTFKLFRVGKCKDAANFVVKGLADRRPKTRERACYTLSELGNKSHVKKMSIVAKSDATYKVIRRTKVYWVRDQCKQAVGRIKLRD